MTKITFRMKKKLHQNRKKTLRMREKHTHTQKLQMNMHPYRERRPKKSRCFDFSLTI